MSETKKNCLTRLIDDEPSSKDFFGPHNRVAKSISEMINSEDGGKAVAIIGNWGSGKSTTIEILKKSLNPKNSVLFIFNAWTHHGDPLRRSFLEKLTLFLEDADFLSNHERWKTFREKLAKRISTQKTKSIPKLTTAGKILTFLVALTPIGIPLSEKLGDDNVACWIPIVGLAILSLPIIFFILLFIFKSKDWEQFLSVIKEESVSDSVTETVQESEPTSVEFQDFFDFILKEANIKNRKLIIVIDNLDRVDPGEALSLWSTMKTFFVFSEQKHDWKKNLWLIVPFDKKALIKLWPETDANPPSPDFQNNLSISFTEKTFIAAFEIAPPLLSDWQKYLKEQLGRAFPNHDIPGDFHKVYRIYNLNGLKKDELPTPREIKVFVNSLGVIHRQWKDEISLPVQALFVTLNKKGDWNPFEQLTSEDDKKILGDITVDLLSANWREELATIAFNVPKDQSLQILLNSKIEKSLTLGDPKILQDSSKLQGFSVIFEKVIESNIQTWEKNEPKVLLLASYVLKTLQLIEDSSLESSWEILEKAVQKLKTIPLLEIKEFEGLITLDQRIESDVYTSHVIEILMKSTTHINVSNVNLWFEGIVSLFQKLNERELQVFRNKFQITFSPDMYLTLIGLLSQKYNLEVFFGLFVPAFPKNAITQELAKTSSEGKLNNIHFPIVKTMQKLGLDWPWDVLINSLNTRLTVIPPPYRNSLVHRNIRNQAVSAPNPVTYSTNTVEIKNSFLILHELSIKQTLANQVLDNLIKNGHLFHHFNLASSNRDFAASAVCLFLALTKLPDANPKSQIYNSQAGINIYYSILDNPEMFKEILEEASKLIGEFELDKVLEKTSETSPRTKKLIGYLIPSQSPKK